MFGNKSWNSYTYESLVRKPLDLEDYEYDDEQAKNEKFDYCKIKLDVDYNTKKIITSFFIKDTNKKTVKKVNIGTVSDLDKYLTFGSSIRMFVTTDLFWASKGNAKRYGVTMKVLQIEIVSNKKSASLREQFSKYAFDDYKTGKYALIDSETEDEEGEEYEEYEEYEDEDEDEEEDPEEYN